MAQFAAYLFDLDGTLIDTAPDLMVSLNHTLKSAGYAEVGEALTRHWVGHGAKVMIQQALTHAGDERLEDTALELLYDRFLSHYASTSTVHSQPYPHVVDTLGRLFRATRKLGVVTNKKQGLSIDILRKLDLYRFFNVVCGGDTMEVQKPAAEPILYACNELDVNPAEALFVGDSTPDVQAAHNAGCPVYVVRDGYNHGVSPSSMGADRVIDSFLDIT